MKHSFKKKTFQQSKPTSIVHRRRLPAELLNEMFRSLPFDIALGFLRNNPGTFGKMDKFLAENVRKMVPKMVGNCQDFIQIFSKAMKNNQWNLKCYGSESINSPPPGGIGFMPWGGAYGEFICVRAVRPIPKMSPIGIIAYFEAKILGHNQTQRSKNA